MSNRDELQVEQERLVNAWARTLPTVLNTSDKARVLADASEPNTVRIHITTAGRSDYSFDFKCTYVDAREVKVDLVDVEQNGTAVDERNDTIQALIDDYVRHIHECAQQLHALTSGR